MKALDESGVDTKVLTVGIDYLENRHKSSFISNADWCQVQSDGTTREYNNQACHGSMKGACALIATISNWATYRYEAYASSYPKEGYRKCLPVGLGERFYDWFCNRSWAAEYVIAPDLGFAMHRGIMFTTDIPANFALAIATMSRNAQEQAHNVHRMYDYVDEFGISEDLAYFLAFGCSTANKYGTIIDGHNLFNNHGSDALDPWMAHKPVNVQKPFNKEGEKRHVNAMWGKSSTNVPASYERFKAKVEMGSVVIPNPFKPVVKSNVLTEEFLRDIIPNIAAVYDRRDNEAKEAA